MTPPNPQGLYESLAPGTTAASLAAAVAEMKKQRTAGFTWLLNIALLRGSVGNIHQYIAECWKVGMNLIIPTHDRRLYDTRYTEGHGDVTAQFPELAAFWGSGDPYWITRNTICLTRGIPNVGFFYAADEPLLQYQEGAQAHCDAIREHIWTAHPKALTIHLSSGSAAVIEPFLPHTGAIGIDVYPVGYPAGYPNGLVSVKNGALDLKARAPSHYRVMVCQAFPWSEFTEHVSVKRWPTVAEYKTMRDYAAFADPHVTLWWTANHIRKLPSSQGGGARPDAAQRWEDLCDGVFA